MRKCVCVRESECKTGTSRVVPNPQRFFVSLVRSRLCRCCCRHSSIRGLACRCGCVRFACLCSWLPSHSCTSVSQAVQNASRTAPTENHGLNKSNSTKFEPSVVRMLRRIRNKNGQNTVIPPFRGLGPSRQRQKQTTEATTTTATTF